MCGAVFLAVWRPIPSEFKLAGKTADGYFAPCIANRLYLSAFFGNTTEFADKLNCSQAIFFGRAE